MFAYAKIPEIKKGVVFSDPSYDETVWCQYRKEFQARNWLMKFESLADKGFVTLKLTLGRPTIHAGVRTEPTDDGLLVHFPGRFQMKEYEIGMDTASIFCGLGEHFHSARHEASIDTGTDGLFGDLMVFTCKGEKDPAGFVLTCGIDEMFMEEQDLFRHFVAAFSAEEITKESYKKETALTSLPLRIAAMEELKHAGGPKEQLKENGPEKGR